MTVRIPEPSLGDTILNLLGKKRGIIVPPDFTNPQNPYTTVMARKENFWRALLRSKHKDFPEGVIDADSIRGDY